MDVVRVLYEDNHLLVVEKPINVPVQADSSGDDDLLSAAKRYVKEKYQKPGAVYLGLVHRLDRPVGGVMAFARTSKAAARLSEQLKTRRMHREYRCVVRGDAPKEGVLADFLLKDGRTNTSSVVPKGTEGAKCARLSFRCIGRGEGLSLLSVALHTGRSHQIRVQMAAAGLPLWGDARYGGGRPGEQIALWANALTLAHPTLRETMTFCAPLPNSFPWTACIGPAGVV